MPDFANILRTMSINLELIVRVETNLKLDLRQNDDFFLSPEDH